MDMWSLYVDYNRSAVVHMYNVASICSGTYVTNVKFMYTTAPEHIIDYIQFI